MRQNSRMRYDTDEQYDDEGDHNSLGVGIVLTVCFVAIVLAIAKLAMR